MKRVLVIGDAIADVYSDYTYTKPMPDAKAQVSTLSRRVILPGGAANVAVNLAVLSPGTQVDLISIFTPGLARQVKYLSRNLIGMDYSYIGDEQVEKERVFIDGALQGRLDNRTRFSDWSVSLMIDRLDQYIRANTPDLIVVSDYALGTITRMSLIELPRSKMIVDTKLTDLSLFDGSLVIKLNRSELRAILESESTPERFCQGLVTTLAEDGATLHMRREQTHHTGKTFSLTHTMNVRAIIQDRKEVVDVCGCGDTFLAGMTASLLKSDDLYTAVQFGNAAAATVVTQARTAVADLEKTLKLLGREEQ